jgi:hypothetical protein
MKLCLIHSQAMRYSDPAHPSPEGEIAARGARELFRNKDTDMFLITVNSVIKGIRECDVLVGRLVDLGVPREALIVQPGTDTTDGEFEAFKDYVDAHPTTPPADLSILTIEAKKGRMELIEKRSNFFPHIYWAEDVLATSPEAEFVKEWRRSVRHFKMRLWLGIAPLVMMKIDPQATLQRRLARLIRHQK